MAYLSRSMYESVHYKTVQHIFVTEKQSVAIVYDKYTYSARNMCNIKFIIVNPHFSLALITFYFSIFYSLTTFLLFFSSYLLFLTSRLIN